MPSGAATTTAPVLRSLADPASEGFRRNAAEHSALAAELRTRLVAAGRGGPERARERHAGRGKLLPRDRVDALVDPGSPFLELSPLAANGMYDDEAPGAGLITGVGRVSGRECVIVANDATVKGGTYYPMTVKKHLRAQEVALHNHLPCIYLVDSGGAFLPMQDEVFPDREHFGRIFYNQATLSARGIPQIAAVLGSCTAGGAYVPAMSDETVIVRGPGHDLPGRSAAGEGGHRRGRDRRGPGRRRAARAASPASPTTCAEDDAHALRIVRSIVATLAPRRRAAVGGPASEEPPVDPAELYGVCPPTGARPTTCARSSPASWTAAVRTSSRRLSAPRWCPASPASARPPGRHRGQQRHPVLRVGAQGRALHRAVRPARHPAGVPAEHHRLHGRHATTRPGGIAKHGAKMVTAVACARVPKFTVIIGGSFGAGNYAHVRARLLARASCGCGRTRASR